VLGILIYFMGMGGAIGERAATLSPENIARDASATDRAERGKVAMRVWGESPLRGVGIGTYAVKQVRHNPGSRPEILIRASGPTLTENPHNIYLQIGAEQGLIGLALYLALLALFFVQGLRALPRLNKGLRQYTLIGAMAAVAGQCVDGLANPGWGYPEVSTFMWLILGIGMCAAGIGSEVPEESRQSSRGTSVMGLPRFLFRGFRTALIGCAALWLGAQLFGLQTLAASAGEQAGLGAGTRAGGSVGRYCQSTNEIAVDFVDNNHGKRPPDSFDSINGTLTGTGTLPVFNGANFKVYAVNDTDPNFLSPSGKLQFFDDVTTEFLTKRLKVTVAKGPGTTLSVAGKITYNRFSNVINYVPKKSTREQRTAILTFTYNCGTALGSFTTTFNLIIPGTG
jgi:hypothetical protein